MNNMSEKPDPIIEILWRLLEDQGPMADSKTVEQAAQQIRDYLIPEVIVEWAKDDDIRPIWRCILGERLSGIITRQSNPIGEGEYYWGILLNGGRIKGNITTSLESAQAIVFEWLNGNLANIPKVRMK